MGRYLSIIMLLAVMPSLVYAQDDDYSDDANDRQSYTRTEGASELKISLSDNAPITVMLDRTKFEYPDRLVRFANIPPRRYRIRVFLDEAGRMRRKNLVYDNYVRVDPSTSYHLVIDHITGDANLTSSELEGNYLVRKKSDYEDYPRSQEEHEVITTEREERNTTDAGPEETLTAEDMSRIRSDLGSAHAVDNRTELLQKALGALTYTTAQVKTMMSWLDTDKEKLRFAKWAYDNTVDTQNYWRIENGFSSEQVKNEFNRFLDGRR